MDKRKIPNKDKYRKLVQFRDMSDEEFDTYWDKKMSTDGKSASFELRIEKKLEEFGKDYDLDDLKINDRETLRALIQAVIALEDYEQLLYRMRTDPELNKFDVNALDRLSNIMTNLRKDISRLQDDLKITRRARKSDKEATVVGYIEDLKARAKAYYDKKLSYVFCPSCNMLLANVWAHYPKADNKLTFYCQRILDDGSRCNTKVVVTTKELIEQKGTNKPEILPESMT